MSLFGGDKEPIDIERNIEDVTVVEVSSLILEIFIIKSFYTRIVKIMSKGKK